MKRVAKGFIAVFAIGAIGVSGLYQNLVYATENVVSSSVSTSLEENVGESASQGQSSISVPMPSSVENADSSSVGEKSESSISEIDTSEEILQQATQETPQPRATISATGVWGDVNWQLDSNGVLTFLNGGTFADSEPSLSGAPDTPNWFAHRSKIKEVIFTSPVKAAAKSSGLFYACSKLEKITNFNLFDISDATDISSMFELCKSLTSLDLSNFNTENVTNMNSLFQECEALTTLDVSQFKTANVEDMSYMFSMCTNLAAIDVSGFDTSKVVTFERMFADNSLLTTLDVSTWNTSNVTNMNGVFSGCKGLVSLDVSKWNTSSAIDMSFMFSNCTNLTTIDVSGFNTSSVTHMGGMFNFCHSLSSIDVSKFDTSKVVEIRSMFAACYNLESIDVSNFKTSTFLDTTNMFYDCKSLISLNLGDNFDTSNILYVAGMFYGCSALTSLDLGDKFILSSANYTTDLFANCNSLKSLTVGPNFKFPDDANLQDYPENSPLQWVGLTTGATFANSVEFMVNYTGGSLADTYIRANTGSISYYLDGGTNAESNPIIYIEGVGIEIFAAASKSGYTFEGWFLDEELTLPITQIATTATGDITLYAKFVKDETVSSEEVSSIPSSSSETSSVVSSVPSSSVVTSSSAVSSVASSAPSSSTPNFKTYAVTFLSYDLKTIQTLYVASGSSVALPSAPAVAGHTFAGWVVEGTNTRWTADEIAPNSDIRLVATYNQDNTNNPTSNANNANGGAPKTGDSAQILPFVSLFLLSSICLIAILVFKKKMTTQD